MERKISGLWFIIEIIKEEGILNTIKLLKIINEI